MILQNYLGAPTDLAKRLYYLGNYLLVKGHHTYLDYFAAGPLEWYPEWAVDLGAPTTTATTKVSRSPDRRRLPARLRQGQRAREPLGGRR